VRFTALMALPWLVCVLTAYVAFRWFFRADLAAPAAPQVEDPLDVPWFAAGVVVATLLGFVGASLGGVDPVWVAAAGAAVLAGRRLVRRRTTVVAVVRSAAPSFCVFVLGLAVVVRAAAGHGLETAVRHALPDGSSLPALLGVVAVSAVLANLVNNLPATLLLLPVAAVSGGVAAALAVLIGVNVGPNLTYGGSLATLLWRRSLHGVDGVPRLGEFSRLGLAVVPASLLLATVALWLAVAAIGTG
jgi:arsenical pump membrane protein